MLAILKLLLSAVFVFLISEVSKRSPFTGAVLASLPVVTTLSMIWIYVETKDTALISQFSITVFWMIIPSLVLLIALPEFLKRQVSFPISLTLSCLLTVAAYYLMTVVLTKAGVKL